MTDTNIINLEEKILKHLDLSILDKEGSSVTSIVILDQVGFETKDIVIFIKGLYSMIFDELEMKYNLVSFNDLFTFDLDFLEIKDIIHRYVYGHIEFINDEDIVKQKELELSLTFIFTTLILDLHKKI